MKILIVDDSTAMQSIIRRGIEQLAYDDINFEKANDGDEALTVIQQWKPDLVVSDWHMPNMNGIDMLYQLNQSMQQINVGFVTTENSEQKIQQAVNAGALFIVQKPFTLVTLHNAIQPIIKNFLKEEILDVDNIKEEKKPLKNNKPKSNAQTSIQLPTQPILTTMINSMFEAPVQCELSDPINIDTEKSSYLLGLYSDEQKKSVHAIAIADIKATYILGHARYATTHSSPDKIIMEHCRYLLKKIATLFNNPQSNTTISLRNINIMHKRNENVERLLKRSAQDRIDIKLIVDDADNTQHNVGYFSLIIA